MKADILSEVTYSPAEKAVLLASFAAQAKYSNHEAEVHADGYLANDRILPESVVNGHKLSRADWEGKIAQFHSKHRGLSRDEAMMEFLKVAQDLETYGINYFDISNKKGSKLSLGLDALGINVYGAEDRLNPKINFPWSDINKINFKGKDFIVKLADKSSPKFVAICEKQRVAKAIYELASGNHMMYMRRRQPDTLEVQQMKAQRKEEEAARLKEKEALNKEISARANAEKMRVEMESKFREMEERMKAREAELEDANSNIRKLEEQLKELREAKEDLETQQQELKEMMEKLNEAKNLEAEERHKMEEEIKAKQEEIIEVRHLVEEKERTAQELQEEVELSKQKLEETTAAFAVATAIKEDDIPEESVNGDENGEDSNSVASAANSDVNGSDEAPSVDIPEIIVDPVEEREVILPKKTYIF